jgi:hypothetical protein
MKQLGNLVIVCEWHDNAKISNIINELNFGETAGKE